MPHPGSASNKPLKRPHAAHNNKYHTHVNATTCHMPTSAQNWWQICAVQKADLLFCLLLFCLTAHGGTCACRLQNTMSSSIIYADDNSIDTCLALMLKEGTQLSRKAQTLPKFSGYKKQGSIRDEARQHQHTQTAYQHGVAHMWILATPC